MLKRIIQLKVYYDRSRQYWGYIKTLALIAVCYKVFEDSKLGIWLYDNLFFIAPVSVNGFDFSSLLIGYLDFKYKIREYEIGEYNKTDPNIQKIHRDLNEIKQILNDNSTDSNTTSPGRWVRENDSNTSKSSR